ncbi:hypothetical protein BaRGS_00015518 [Batillaria attramentaria]|uniref:Uncharacterized protein n=1 Tax=Batillaria attramentaria TaxID=370345 RepID=A0ABD0L128_9CAEN
MPYNTQIPSCNADDVALNCYWSCPEFPLWSNLPLGQQLELGRQELKSIPPTLLTGVEMYSKCTLWGYGVQKRRSSEDSRTEQDRAGCPEGWLQSHGYCLYPTHLPEAEAEVFCEQEGALQAQGICIRKPSSDATSGTTTDEDDDKDTDVTSDSTGHVCPQGWTRYDNYCFFSPPGVAQICSLLGAKHVFGYCVTRVPSLLSTDFVRTVKRLDGSDYNMHSEWNGETPDTVAALVAVPANEVTTLHSVTLAAQMTPASCGPLADDENWESHAHSTLQKKRDK